MDPKSSEPPQPDRPMPAHYTRRRRGARRRKGLQIHIVLIFLIVIGGAVFAGWKWYNFASRSPIGHPERAQQERAETIAAINKILADAGKSVPLADVVVDSAEFKERDGQRYLVGRVRNRSAITYSGVHLAFQTYDLRHDRAEVVEGDIGRVGAGEAASFDFGPVTAKARTASVSSITPLK